MSAEVGKGPSPSKVLIWIFAVVGLLGFLAFILLMVSTSGSRTYQPAKVKAERTDGVFTIRHVQELRGTSLLSMTIAASEAEGGSSSYSGDDRRNILLLDKVTGRSRRILPDNSRQIHAVTYLSTQGKIAAPNFGRSSVPPDDTGPRSQPPPAYYLLTVFQPGQRPLRKQDVLVGSLASGRQAFVMRGIDGIDSSWMHSPTQIGVLVREDLSLHYRVVDIPTLKVVQSRRVEIG